MKLSLFGGARPAPAAEQTATDFRVANNYDHRGLTPVELAAVETMRQAPQTARA